MHRSTTSTKVLIDEQDSCWRAKSEHFALEENANGSVPGIGLTTLSRFQLTSAWSMSHRASKYIALGRLCGGFGPMAVVLAQLDLQCSIGL